MVQGNYKAASKNVSLFFLFFSEYLVFASIKQDYCLALL